jgi:hypothetical protein
MERGTFLSQTKLVPVLEETIKVLSWDNWKNKDLSARLVAIAKKRLSEISKTQE